jgi:DnaJ-class molecular chaperone
MNPYLVLGVPSGANDQTIRRAYLEAIKQSPPEADPKRFQAASQAYEKIKDQESRHRHILFDHDCPANSPLDALARYASHCRHLDPPAFDAMKEFLRAAARSGGK